MTTAVEDTEHRVLVIGAAGGVGRAVVRLLRLAGHEVVGMHRSPGQDAVIREAGGEPIRGDLIADSVATLADRMAGCDAVVFSAGAHGTGADKTTAIDGQGLVKCADAARQAGVRRFVLVSVFLDAGRSASRSEGFEHYMRVKREADVYLAATDLDWLIVRPGTLRDTPGTGLVDAGVAIAYGDIPRDDVAAFIAACLFRPELNRTAVELTAGDVPVDEAVAGLVPRNWHPG